MTVNDAFQMTRDADQNGWDPSGYKLTAWAAAYSLNLAVACFITYWIITRLLSGFVDQASDFLGGMWAVVAVVFVFRDTREQALRAGRDRLFATCVSFALCQLYLLIFPFTPLGMAALLGLGALIITALHRRGDIVTTGITTTVVMVVAAMNPETAWQQPILRLIDSVFGISVGVICKWVGSYLFSLSEHDLGGPEVRAAHIGLSHSTSRFDTEHKGEIK
jgi:uncharacterized membrane protein YgaE (UPF0421/DUF939 family)